MKYNQGYFIPKFPEKYVGDVNNIIYRSGLEARFFSHFDKKKEILKWGSEEISVKYFYSIDKQYHRYFPDLIIEYLNKKNEKRKAIIEIKSSNDVINTIYHLFNLKSFKKEKSLQLIKESLKIDEKGIAGLLKEYRKPKKITKKYVEYLNGIMKNIDKWLYALEFCKKNDLEFYVFTEKDLE
jgi:hypothetical protein